MAAIRDRVRSWLGLTEAVDLSQTYVDRRDEWLDPDGTQWLPIGMTGRPDQERTGFVSEADWANARGICRALARQSAYAIGAHQARVSYIAGTGHKYVAVAKKDREVADEKLGRLQTALDEWCYENDWYRRQQETVLRRDRDGEVFIRKFITDDKRPIVRFVEPDQVATPIGKNGQASKGLLMGIECDPNDVETVLAYWVDGERVDAADIQHRKGQVDCNVRRGIPLMWPVVTTLGAARKVNANMARGSAIQTSIAYLRRILGGTRTGGEAIRAEKATFTRSNAQTNKLEYLEEQKGGRIITTGDNMEYEFPFAGTRYDQYVQVVQSNLREVASMLQMPEFMLTADASNANYSSTMIAEGPCVKNFERLQKDQECDDLKILWWVLGVILGEDYDTTDIEIQVTMPSLTTRDKLKDAQEAQLWLQSGILSPQTATAQAGLDYAQEQENIEQHRGAVEGANGVEPVDYEGGDTTATTTDAVVGGDVQATALNGAQVSAMIDIAVQTATAALPKETAKALIAAAFPLVTPEKINSIIDPIEAKEPEPEQPIAGLAMAAPKGKPGEKVPPEKPEPPAKEVE